MYVKCKKCGGNKQYRAIGFTMKKCDVCSGIGYINEADDDSDRKPVAVENGAKVSRESKEKPADEKREKVVKKRGRPRKSDAA